MSWHSFDSEEMALQLHKLNDAIKNRTCSTQCIVCGGTVRYNYVLCRKCKAKNFHAYKIYRFIRKRWSDPKAASKRRGRKCAEAGTHSVTMRNIIDILARQRFRCYYSGMPLVFAPNSPQTCSAERLINKRGYDNGNMRFCAKMFNSWHSIDAYFNVNGSANWSRYKFNEWMLFRWNRLLIFTDYNLSS